MLLRNDSGVPLHIPPSDTGPAALVPPGDEIEHPTYVTGLTALDHEFVDGDWRPTEPPTKPTKTPPKGKQQSGDDAEGVPA